MSFCACTVKKRRSPAAARAREQLRAQRETLRTHLRLEQFPLTELQRAQSDVEDPDAFRSSSSNSFGIC